MNIFNYFLIALISPGFAGSFATHPTSGYSYHFDVDTGDYVVVDGGDKYVINCREGTLIRVANPKQVSDAFETPLGSRVCTDMAQW
ncbi:hypothetical protein [Synechococcus sp. UW140]|uniref:hypothetical protein n=1 Tax=Synechococcus sp. UW140 TaxID=368503 RepID=UPI0010BD3DB0|nr:hypothetical protein [Synechococcus sp. UW140]